MNTTADLVVPYTRQQLDEHYLPPEPHTTVTVAVDTRSRLQTLRTELDVALAAVDAEQRAAVADLTEAAAVDGGRQALDAALDAAADADRHNRRTTIERRLTAVTDADRIVSAQLDHARRTDPTYLAWLADCRRILSDWVRVSSAHYPEPGDRQQALTMFAHTHRPQVTP